METRLCLLSALELWHIVRIAERSSDLVDPANRRTPVDLKRSRITKLTPGSPSQTAIEDALTWATQQTRNRSWGFSHPIPGITNPVHVLVSSDTACWRTPYRIPHRVQSPLLPGSLVRLTPSLVASSPEHIFLQMARHLSPLQLTWLGCTLCATYTMHPRCITSDDLNDDSLFSAHPLTTRAILIRYLTEACSRHINGARKARKAACSVVEGAASPREIELALLGCLPRAMGGRALPIPQLNHRIAVDKRMGSIRHAYFSVDVCWPDARVALEYDSDTYHLDPHKRAHDNDKRAALEQLGYWVLPVSSKQLDSLTFIDDVLKRVGAHLGVRDRSHDRRYDWHARRSQLRRALHNLAFHGIPWPGATPCAPQSTDRATYGAEG